MTFPFETLRVPRQQAIGELLRLRQTNQLTPVILAGQNEPAEFAHHMSYSQSTLEEDLEHLADVVEPLPARWLARQKNDFPEQFAVSDATWRWDVPPVSVPWAVSDRKHRNMEAEVVIAVLPTPTHWMAPLLLRFGNRNSCPLPVVHAAWAKNWQERYGAVIAAASHDTLEFTVANPAQTKKEALELALQHYHYADDIVDQNYGSVEALAASLYGATVWSFWWD